MEILRLGTEAEQWAAYVDHLKRVDMARWVVDDADQPSGAFLFLGAVVDGEVVGNLALREQPITLPATEWSGGKERLLEEVTGTSTHETFVQTFAVDEAYRRRGIGRALQEAALRWTAERGCWQMRSWSSLDKPENYALKLSLGFAMHPEVQVTPSGLKVSGVYFVRHVDPIR